ncbi:glycoside hydrolase superfamily [Naematelia encephala]|uniref:Glycoside hydrolase superfamily n=1 Tax=Naematelia encephala TaxID=71784 RepID=A0A1Y2BHH0_9TREE|nr:glycoside hydrolase superfamily [Naematelia encephala]
MAMPALPSDASSTGAADASPTSDTSSPSNSGAKRNMAYWSVWSSIAKPSYAELENMTHMILSFVDMTTFDSFLYSSTGGFDQSTAGTLRGINPNLKVIGGVGGWAYDVPFRPASQTDSSRSAFAQQVKSFIDTFNLNGVDIDWEFPVYGSQGYKLPTSDPNARPRDDDDAPNFALLLQAIRSAIGSDKLLSVALPSRQQDMLAYTNSTIVALMDSSLDFWNVMSYDAVNRRDSLTDYHAGGIVINRTIDAYSSVGIAKNKMNIGYPTYARYFELSPDSNCSASNPIGCPIPVSEDGTGNDLGYVGEYTFDITQDSNTTVTDWFENIASSGTDSTDAQASAWYDEKNHVFWTWVSPSDILSSCQQYLPEVGGVFYWSWNSDTNGAAGGPHIDAINSCVGGS